MTNSAGPGSPRLSDGPLCSTWAREQRLDPIGTAGCYTGYLLVEWPLPWPRDMSEDPALAPVMESARRAGMRFQALVPASEAGPCHVVAYRWPAAGGARFARNELAVDQGEAIAAALAVLSEPPRRDGPPRRDEPPRRNEPPSRNEPIDVLICTHGGRDRCCGSLGTALAQELSAAPHPLGQGVRVWRTSHTGGHRFAPTAVVLPQGTAWAFCDRAALARIAQRNGPMDDLLPRYRGCSGMRSQAIQALERAVLSEVGWRLLDMARWGADLGGDRIELVVEDPSGERAVWEAHVRSEMLPVPDCRQPLELATKREAQWVVEGLRRR